MTQTGRRGGSAAVSLRAAAVMLLLLGVVAMHALSSGTTPAHAGAPLDTGQVHAGALGMPAGHAGPAGCADDCPPALGHLGAVCLAVLGAAVVGWLLLYGARLRDAALATLWPGSRAVALLRRTSRPLAPPSLLVLCTSRT